MKVKMAENWPREGFIVFMVQIIRSGEKITGLYVVEKAEIFC